MMLGTPAKGRPADATRGPGLGARPVVGLELHARFELRVGLADAFDGRLDRLGRTYLARRDALRHTHRVEIAKRVVGEHLHGLSHGAPSAAVVSTDVGTRAESIPRSPLVSAGSRLAVSEGNHREVRGHDDVREHLGGLAPVRFEVGVARREVGEHEPPSAPASRAIVAASRAVRWP